jgi:hypothetical protein
MSRVRRNHQSGRAARGEAARPEPAEHSSSFVEMPSRPKRRDSDLTALFVKKVREGPWAPAPHVDLVAVIGDVTLDFTAAHLRAGVTVIDLAVSLSWARLIVPQGLAVDVDAQIILGSVRRDPGIPERPEIADEPSLLVVGHAMLSRLKIRLAEG